MGVIGYMFMFMCAPRAPVCPYNDASGRVSERVACLRPMPGGRTACTTTHFQPGSRAVLSSRSSRSSTTCPGRVPRVRVRAPWRFCCLHILAIFRILSLDLDPVHPVTRSPNHPGAWVDWEKFRRSSTGCSAPSAAALALVVVLMVTLCP